MPRFDFRCTTCQRIREDVWVSNYRDATDTFDAALLAPCDHCGARTWEKVPAAPNFSIGGFAAKNNYGLR